MKKDVLNQKNNYEEIDIVEYDRLCAPHTIEEISGEFIVYKDFTPVFGELEKNCPSEVIERYGQSGRSEYLAYLYYVWEDFYDKVKDEYRLCFAIQKKLPDGKYVVRLTKKAFGVFKEVIENTTKDYKENFMEKISGTLTVFEAAADMGPLEFARGTVGVYAQDIWRIFMESITQLVDRKIDIIKGSQMVFDFCGGEEYKRMCDDLLKHCSSVNEFQSGSLKKYRITLNAEAIKKMEKIVDNFLVNKCDSE